MKSLNKLCGLCLTAFVLILINPAKTLAQPGYSVSYQTFYDELQPYGTWIDDPNYGNVWVPDAEEGFKPYASQGHWVQTPYGNTWVSDYRWGWAAFHYGRWRFDDYYGWEWIPGNEWGPAWVNWRRGGGYYGWAPLGPRISIDISFGDSYRVPYDYWVFAPQAYICSPRIYDYYEPRTRVVNIINNTTIINNVYVNNNTRYVTGPRPHEIEQVTNSRVQVYNINNVNNPRSATVQNNTVNVYRPNIVSTHNGDRPRPATVVDATAYRSAHPADGIANRAAGATIRPDNAARLAQAARNPGQENSNVVRVNRPSSINNNRGNQIINPQNGNTDNRRSYPTNDGISVRPNRNSDQPNSNANRPGTNRNNQQQPQVQNDQQRQQQRQQMDQQRQQRAQQQPQVQTDQQRQQQRQQVEQQRPQPAPQRQPVEQQRQQPAPQRQPVEPQRQQPAPQQRAQPEQRPQPEQRAQPQPESQQRDRRSGDRPTN